MSGDFDCRWYDAAIKGSDDRGPHCSAPIIALHCSGADGSQWRKLASAIDPETPLFTPDLVGTGDTGPWQGERAFTLLDEARAIVDMVDAVGGAVHLVGHSYGGGVAMKVAMARPAKIVSLTLYEPSAFHILKQLGPRGDDQLREIEGLAAAVSLGVVTGAYHEATAAFVDYWNGQGTWKGLRPDIRDALVKWLPKAPLDFRALLDDDTPVANYRRLTCPVLVMRGEHARGPSRLIAGEIARQVPAGTCAVIEGAGHMGPVTHAAEVVERIIAHIALSETKSAKPQGIDWMAA